MSILEAGGAAMLHGEEYYCTEVAEGWRLKRVGGVTVLKVFPTREAALLHAQVMISRQHAVFRFQNRQGQWQKV